MSVEGVKALEREVPWLLELTGNEKHVKVWVRDKVRRQFLFKREDLPETREEVLDVIGTLITGIPVIGEED